LNGNTLAIGAYGEKSAATGINGDQSNTGAGASGAVYVFTRSGTNWTQQAYIKASNTGTGDGFGRSVSLYGDTIVVGACGEASAATGINGDQSNNDAPASGAVYVFTRSGTTWSQQAYIKASNTGASDLFGWNISLYENTLAVGAYQEDSDATGINGSQSDNDATDSGAVYVLSRSGTTWTQQAYIKASNTEEEDNFGCAVSLYGDLLAVGAYMEDGAATGIDGDQIDNSANASGAVYVFSRSGTTWLQQAYVKESNNDTGDFFGNYLSLYDRSLAVAGLHERSAATGVNGDQDDDSTQWAGAVYLFYDVAEDLW